MLLQTGCSKIVCTFFFFFCTQCWENSPVLKCYGQHVCRSSNLNKGNHLHSSQHAKRSHLPVPSPTKCSINTFWLLLIGWITHWEECGRASCFKDWAWNHLLVSQHRNTWSSNCCSLSLRWLCLPVSALGTDQEMVFAPFPSPSWEHRFWSQAGLTQAGSKFRLARFSK